MVRTIVPKDFTQYCSNPPLCTIISYMDILFLCNVSFAMNYITGNCRVGYHYQYFRYIFCNFNLSLIKWYLSDLSSASCINIITDAIIDSDQFAYLIQSIASASNKQKNDNFFCQKLIKYFWAQFYKIWREVWRSVLDTIENDPLDELKKLPPGKKLYFFKKLVKNEKWWSKSILPSLTLQKFSL